MWKVSRFIDRNPMLVAFSHLNFLFSLRTTIIESLKYAVTGSFPPGSKGQAFVHDPRNVNMSQVKASVKLRFNSRANKTVVVTRSMELNLKKDKITFKQLDGVIKMREEATGDIVSLSHKCSELDKQIPMLLGVSKAILEHVIFCHQEESSWPFSDSAAVKKRFDEIFDSARYTKAIKEFQTTEKTMLSQAKDIKIELAELSANQRTANDFKRDLESHNEQMEEIDSERKQLNEQIEAAAEEEEKWDRKMDEAEEIQTQVVRTKEEIKNTNQLIQTLLGTLEEDLTEKHTIQDLEDMLDGFDSKVSDQSRELEKLRARQTEYDAQVRDLRSQEAEFQGRVGRLLAEKEAQEKRLAERSRKMDELANSYQLTFSQSQSSPDRSFASQASRRTHFDSSALTSDEIEVFFDGMSQHQEALRRELEEFENKAQEENDRISSELAESKHKLIQLEKDIEKNTLQSSNLQKEYDSLRDHRPGASRVRESDIEEMEIIVRTTRKAFEQANDESKRKDIEAEIARCKKKIEDIRMKEEGNREALTLLRQLSNAHNEIRNLRDQEVNELEMLREKLRGQFPSMLRFNIRSSVPGVPSAEEDPSGDEVVRVCESLRDDVETKMDSIQNENRLLNEELVRIQQKLSERSAVASSTRHQIESMRGSISRLEDPKGTYARARNLVLDVKSYAASLEKDHLLDQSNFEGVLSFLDDTLKELDEKAEVTPQSIKWFTKMLLRFASKGVNEGTKETECPCCTKILSPSEGLVLGQNLKTLRKRLRDEVVDTSNSNQTDTLKNWRESIAMAVPDHREILRLNSEIAILESKLESPSDDIKSLETDLRNIKEKSSDCEKELTELRDLLSIASQWNTEALRIAGLRSSIRTKREDISQPGGIDGRDLDSVEHEMLTLAKEKDSEMMTMNRLNTSISDINKNVASLSDQLTKQKERLAAKREMFKKDQENLIRREAIGSEMNQLGESTANLRQQIDPLRRKIKSKEKEKESVLSVSRKEQKSRSDAYQHFKGEISSLRELCHEIDLFASSGKIRSDGEIKKEQDTLKVKLRNVENKIHKLLPDIHRAQAAVEHHERHKKQLQQNLDILHSRSKIHSLSEEVEKLSRSMHGMVPLKIASERFENAKKIKDQGQDQLARLEGRYHEINEQVRSIKRKLASEDLKDVDERYRVAKIKHDTTLIAAEDLKKYWSALDKALLKYHSVKIADINKIIRELWLMTYKGEDITNIELVSGQEPGSKAQKSYNYRVVMTKGSAQLDMRGRCSAGQRVLASIVVRLALAETFCITCGCIALDEPTVNLDYRNKEGLAVALAQIVSSRAAQRNFQLILITHDEEFVNMMKNELSSHTGFAMPDKYFQVCREISQDGKYYSKIRGIDWDAI